MSKSDRGSGGVGVMVRGRKRRWGQFRGRTPPGGSEGARSTPTTTDAEGQVGEGLVAASKSDVITPRSGSLLPQPPYLAPKHLVHLRQPSRTRRPPHPHRLPLLKQPLRQLRLKQELPLLDPAVRFIRKPCAYGTFARSVRDPKSVRSSISEGRKGSRRGTGE